VGPLRRVQRPPAPPLTPTRLQDVVATRRDVLRGGMALALRAAARRARAPSPARSHTARPLRRAPRSGAAPRKPRGFMPLW
jgi:hypothetical protein